MVLLDSWMWVYVLTALIPVHGILYWGCRRERKETLKLLKASLRLKVRR